MESMLLVLLLISGGVGLIVITFCLFITRNKPAPRQYFTPAKVRPHVPGTNKYGKAKSSSSDASASTASCGAIIGCGSSSSDGGGFSGGDSGGGGASSNGCASTSSCSSGSSCSGGSSCGGGGGD